MYIPYRIQLTESQIMDNELISEISAHPDSNYVYIYSHSYIYIYIYIYIYSK